MLTNIWLKIKGKKNYYGETNAIGTIVASKTRPSTAKDEIAIKIELDIPSKLFDQPIYTAKVVLPEPEFELPPLAAIGESVQKALSKSAGFKINVEMSDGSEENQTL